MPYTQADLKEFIGMADQRRAELDAELRPVFQELIKQPYFQRVVAAELSISGPRDFSLSDFLKASKAAEERYADLVLLALSECDGNMDKALAAADLAYGAE